MYKKVSLLKYFDIKSVIQNDKINFEVTERDNVDAIPFLGRSSVNNGIVDYVKRKEEFVNKGGKITIALDGSTGATFYQHHDFSSGQNIWELAPRKDYFDELNPLIYLFLVTSIRKAVTEYSWNLSLTKTRLSNININLPILENEKVDISLIKQKMNGLRNINFIKNIPPEQLK